MYSSVAVGMLVCLAGLVVSPVGDVPMTTLTGLNAVEAAAYSGRLILGQAAAPEPRVLRVKQRFFRETSSTKLDLLSRIAAYRC